MNIPTIPTDNLYKFLSVGGLTLAISSLVSVIAFSFYMIPFVGQTYQNIEKSSNQRDLIRWEMETASHSAELLISNTTNGNISQGERDFAYSIIQDYNKIKSDYGLYLTEIWPSTKRSDQEFLFLNDIFNAIYKISMAGIFIGTSTSIFGFISWYKNVQRYEDILIKEKVARLKGGRKNNKQTQVSSL